MNTDAPSSHPAGPAMIALNPQGVVAMKRDMDLVAKIMDAVEAKRDLRPAPISVEGYDEWVVQRHIEAMEAAGLIDGLVSRQMSQAYPTVLVRDLTWEGHEFAATLKSPAWQEVKARLSRPTRPAPPPPPLRSRSLPRPARASVCRLGIPSVKRSDRPDAKGTCFRSVQNASSRA